MMKNNERSHPANELFVHAGPVTPDMKCHFTVLSLGL